MAGFFLADAFLDVVRGSSEEDVADGHQRWAAEAGRVGVIEAFAVLFGGVRDVEFEFQYPGNAVFLVGDVVELEAAGLLQEELADDEASGSVVPGFGHFFGRVVLHFPGDVVFADEGFTHGDRRELVSGLFGVADGDELHSNNLSKHGVRRTLSSDPVFICIKRACEPPGTSVRNTPPAH